MAEPANNQVPEPPLTDDDRGLQRTLGLLVALVIALIAYRGYSDRARPRPLELKRENLQVELNRAGRTELMQLPGVGPSRADKILAYRAANGGFQNVEDLRSVDGIGEVTLARLRPHVQVGSAPEPADEPLRLSRKPPAAPGQPPARSTGKKPLPDSPININSAGSADLQSLPGIGPALAQRIIDERERKPFTKVEDLRRVSGIGAKRLEQLRPHVAVE